MRFDIVYVNFFYPPSPGFKVMMWRFHPYLQAGMQAVRENRYIILAKDFEKAYKKAIKKDDKEHDFYK